VSSSAPSLANKTMLRHRQGYFLLDTTFALIEGHPRLVCEGQKERKKMGHPPFADAEGFSSGGSVLWTGWVPMCKKFPSMLGYLLRDRDLILRLRNDRGRATI
jgi:hypothetical protein